MSNTTERPIVPLFAEPTHAPGRCLWPAPQRPTHGGQLQGRWNPSKRAYSPPHEPTKGTNITAG